MNLNSKTALQSNESFVELEIPEKRPTKVKMKVIAVVE